MHPGAAEEANGVDDDCDGLVDEGTEAYDADGDGVSPADGDCDDAEPWVNPDATEVCNAVDDNCDGDTDEGCGEDTAADTGSKSPDECGCGTPGPAPAAAGLLVAIGMLWRRFGR